MGSDEGYFVVGGGGEDMPDELKKLLHQLIGGAAQEPQESFEDTIKPSSEQYKLGPGDLVMVMEEDRSQCYELLRLKDPEEYAEQFPDWEERLWNSYLFGMATIDEKQWVPAWMPRATLIKIEPWQWDALIAHNTDRVRLDVPCDWLIRLFGETMYSLTQNNRDQNVPEPIACGNCGEHAVMVEIISHRKQFSLAGGFGTQEGRDHTGFYALSTEMREQQSYAKLYCVVCDTQVSFDLDEHSVYFTP